MLDLKLANYLPFMMGMRPGIFLACSDEFESFDFDEQLEKGKLFGADGNEIVLIAHKSGLQIAKDHGVYVLDNEKSGRRVEEKGIYDCKMVLQKPSIDKMRNLGIVLNVILELRSSVYYKYNSVQ